MTGAQDAQGGLSVAGADPQAARRAGGRIVVVSDEPKKHQRARPRARHHGALTATSSTPCRRSCARSPASRSSSTTSSAPTRPAGCASAASRRSAPPASSSTRPPARAAATAAPRATACRCSRSRPSWAARPRSTRPRATPTTPAWTATARRFLTVQVASGQAREARRRRPPRPCAEPALAGRAPTSSSPASAAPASSPSTSCSRRPRCAATSTPPACRAWTRSGCRRRPARSPRTCASVDRGPANRVGKGTADVLLAFDLLVAADPKNLALCSPASTVAVVSHLRDARPARRSPTPHARQDRHCRRCSRGCATCVARVVEIDALGASEALFGSTAPANLLLVGAAYQLGALPFSGDRRRGGHRAQRRRGRGERRRLPLGPRRGRRPGRLRRRRVARPPPRQRAPSTSAARRWPARPAASSRCRAQLLRAALRRRGGPPLRRRRRAGLGRRAGRRRTQTAYSEAVARGVAHLAAYKDEYEVARLLTRPELLAEVQQQVPGATDVRFNLHPPVLRAMGMDRKLKLGAWTRAAAQGDGPGQGRCAARRSTRSAGRTCASSSASCSPRTPPWSRA